ncbi:MAG: Maf family protein [Lachnospiraceae bacterium]|nr:Maf family protein [Lachnospiraceae bacterium]
MERQIILASQSPRRRELLTQAGFCYQVEPSQVIEKITKEEPWEVVMELSEQKAEDVYRKHMEASNQIQDASSILVIGADTVVAFQNQILGKPHTEQEAFDMLMQLQGEVHQVYTGVALCWNEEDGMHKHVFYERTEVSFYPMTEQEIWDYIHTGDCMDKAGAYGIQTHFGVYIRAIQGDYNNVVGLPIARLYQEIKDVRIGE